MAFTITLGDSTNTAVGTSHAVVAPSGSGGMLAIFFLYSTGGGSTTPTGWTLAASAVAGPLGRCYLRKATGGADDTPATLITAAARRSRVLFYRVTGGHPELLPEVVAAVTTSTTIDPPIITPSWGSQASLFVALGFAGAATGNLPAAYTDNNLSGSVGGAAPFFNVGSREATTASEDPGAFSAASSQNWGAFTVAFAPVITRTCAPALVTPALEPSFSASRTAIVRTGALEKSFDVLIRASHWGLARTPAVRTASPALLTQQLAAAWDLTRTAGVRAASPALAAPAAVSSFSAARTPAIRTAAPALSAAALELGPHGQDHGPASPTTGANDTSVGTISWTSTGNVFASDDVKASVVLATVGNVSNYLKVTGFSLAVPADSTITGVTVAVEKLSTGGVIRDHSVKLVKGGVISGDDKTLNTALGSSDNVVSYGGPNDLWGLSLTPADVNDAAFGAVWAATRSSGTGSATARVDHIALTVHVAKSLARTAAVRTSAPSLGAEGFTVALIGTCESTTCAVVAALVTPALAAAVAGAEQFQTRACEVAPSLEQLVGACEGARSPAIKTGSTSLIGTELAVVVAGADQFQVRSSEAALSSGVTTCELDGLMSQALRIGVMVIGGGELTCIAAAAHDVAVRSGTALLVASAAEFACAGSRVAVTRTCEVAVTAASSSCSMDGARSGQERSCAVGLTGEALVYASAGGRTPATHSCVVVVSCAGLVVTVEGADQFQVRTGDSAAMTSELGATVIGDATPEGARRAVVSLTADPLGVVATGRRVVKRVTWRAEVVGSAGELRRDVGGGQSKSCQVMGSGGAPRGALAGSYTSDALVSGSAGGPRHTPGSGVDR